MPGSPRAWTVARRRLRRSARRRPAWAALAAAVLAWVAVVARHLDAGPAAVAAPGTGHPSAGHAPGGHAHLHGAAAGGEGTVWASVVAPTVGLLPMWVTMCVAMMVPASLPVVAHVGRNSLRWRRQRAVGTFLSAYLAVWAAFGAVVLAALAALAEAAAHFGAGDGVAAGVLAAAVGGALVWPLLPSARRFRRACHRTSPLPPRGWPATRGCLRFGLRHGLACAGVCGPAMVVMAAVWRTGPSPAAGLVWMAALTAAVAWLKLAPRRWSAAALLASVRRAAAVRTPPRAGSRRWRPGPSAAG